MFHNDFATDRRHGVHDSLYPLDCVDATLPRQALSEQLVATLDITSTVMNGEATGCDDTWLPESLAIDRILIDREAEPNADRLLIETDTLATLAHELRAPLATLQVTLELLAGYPTLAPEDVDQLVGRLRRGVTWMNGLVDNLGAWTAAREGRLKPQRAPIHVMSWIEPTIAMVQPILDRKDQRVRVNCPEPATMVDGDELRLSQVLMNLLVNASRYGAWGDTIDITVTDTADQVCIRVTDYGIGIPPEEQERIFERFVRGVNASDAAIDGQGIGLDIVRVLVELHGGSVGVECTPGNGTTFWFQLPRIDPADSIM